MYKIDEYIPDIFYEQFDTVRETLVDWMVKLGIISGKGKIKSSPDAPCMYRPLLKSIVHHQCETTRIGGRNEMKVS